jgi:tRNA(adenine34) deaminase
LKGNSVAFIHSEYKRFSVMTHEYYMLQALKEAKKAFEDDEIPIGAVVVLNEKIIARGHNMTERLNDPTAHAEMIALTSAFNTLGSKYLPEATLYVTVEPCLMCAGAIYWSKLRKTGTNGSLPQTGLFIPKLN